MSGDGGHGGDGGHSSDDDVASRPFVVDEEKEREKVADLEVGIAGRKDMHAIAGKLGSICVG